MDSIQHQSFDAVAFETKHQADFERFQKQAAFGGVVENPAFDEYADGRQDGLINFQPTPQQWSSSEYRAGYLDGIETRYNERFLDN